MPSIQSAVSEFLLNCAAENKADSTIRWYRSILTTFSQMYPVTLVGDIDAHQIREYLARLRLQEYSEDTIGDYTRALHRFWRWAAEEYELKNPMRNIKYPQPPKPKQPKAVRMDDAIAMFRAALDGMYPERDQAILAFALDSGARREGLCTVLMDDLDMRGSTFVTEKGRETRPVIFTKVTTVLLYRWMEKRNPQVPELFYNLDTLEALTGDGMYQLFRRLGKRAGVKGHYNPHSFRHAFAKGYAQAGGDIFTLAEILGHKDINTTKIYAVFTNEEIKAAHEKYSPVHQLVKGEEE